MTLVSSFWFQSSLPPLWPRYKKSGTFWDTGDSLSPRLLFFFLLSWPSRPDSSARSTHIQQGCDDYIDLLCIITAAFSYDDFIPPPSSISFIMQGRKFSSSSSSLDLSLNVDGLCVMIRGATPSIRERGGYHSDSSSFIVPLDLSKWISPSRSLERAFRSSSSIPPHSNLKSRSNRARRGAHKAISNFSSFEFENQIEIGVNSIDSISSETVVRFKATFRGSVSFITAARFFR